MEGVSMKNPWAYHENRYSHEGYADEASDERSDGDIKQDLLDQIRTGPYADQYDIQVDVKKGVVILTGTAGTTVAKRAGGRRRLGPPWGDGRQQPDPSSERRPCVVLLVEGGVSRRARRR